MHGVPGWQTEMQSAASMRPMLQEGERRWLSLSATAGEEETKQEYEG